MPDLTLSGLNVSRAVRSAFKGRLQDMTVWRGGVAYPTDGFIETSTGGGRATIIQTAVLDAIGRPVAGDEVSVAGDDRRWRVLSVSGVPGVSWTAELARGLEDAPESFQPVELAVAAFDTYVSLQALTGLPRGHRMEIQWEGPTSGTLFTSRGIVLVQNLTPNSDYIMTQIEYDADGRPSEPQRFTARTT